MDKKKRTMSFTADAEILDAFKDFCKRRGVNQSLVLDTCMRCFIEGKIVLKFEGEQLVLAEAEEK